MDAEGEGDGAFRFAGRVDSVVELVDGGGAVEGGSRASEAAAVVVLRIDGSGLRRPKLRGGLTDELCACEEVRLCLPSVSLGVGCVDEAEEAALLDAGCD